MLELGIYGSNVRLAKDEVQFEILAAFPDWDLNMCRLGHEYSKQCCGGEQPGINFGTLRHVGGQPVEPR
ncbi:hypothetical protein [uncultured Shimia sp.]|uniref:hypothetical protein n=1 Tax=uncultured Shimia sp. TaxID=573152 RepID=UPI0025D3EC26|nr:hypothetical protein [uncultured Shimia sp.]